MQKRRGVLRREQKEAREILQKAQKAEEQMKRRGFISMKQAEDLYRKGFLEGRNFGYKKALGLIMQALREAYKFGNKRMTRLLEEISRESIKMDEMPTQIAEEYMEKIYEKIEKETKIKMEIEEGISN